MAPWVCCFGFHFSLACCPARFPPTPSRLGTVHGDPARQGAAQGGPHGPRDGKRGRRRVKGQPQPITRPMLPFPMHTPLPLFPAPVPVALPPLLVPNLLFIMLGCAPSVSSARMHAFRPNPLSWSPSLCLVSSYSSTGYNPRQATWFTRFILVWKVYTHPKGRFRVWEGSKGLSPPSAKGWR